MVYVALAERLGTELVTADERLRARLAHLDWVRSIGDA
jgi:predicted nucleic acid-binding protein